MKRMVALVVLAALAAAGCSKIKTGYNKVVAKDVNLEDQKMLNEKYVGKYAWTRVTLEDLSETETPGEPRKQIVPRDTKVEVVELKYVYSGAVTVLDPKNRRITHGLDIEEPLTVEKIEKRLSEIMWFKSPLLRHVDYIRKWGKRYAQAVMDHEVLVGMPEDAALESWGLPSEIQEIEVAGQLQQQWAYRHAKRTDYIILVEGKVIEVEQ